ncbi:3-hydroxyacyl-ACP dehydratase [Thermodesulfobacteriota bacterium]
MNRLRNEIKESATTKFRMTDDGAGLIRYRFSPEFTGFSGHFPGYPILPAIVQVLCGSSAVEEFKGSHLETITVEKAKFLLEIKPDQEIEVECRKQSIRDRQGFNIRLMTEEGLASSFFMTFREKE